MSALSSILRKSGAHRVSFFCPGCDSPHSIPVSGEGTKWEYNGNPEAPTFAPSLKITGGSDYCCHIFVRDGQIEFLTDCTHALAGQTVPIPPWPESWGDGDPQ